MKKQEVTKGHKTSIIQMHEQGKNAEEIQKKYPQYSRMQIAAIKAHCTMKTYDYE